MRGSENPIDVVLGEVPRPPPLGLSTHVGTASSVYQLRSADAVTAGTSSMVKNQRRCAGAWVAIHMRDANAPAPRRLPTKRYRTHHPPKFPLPSPYPLRVCVAPTNNVLIQKNNTPTTTTEPQRSGSLAALSLVHAVIDGCVRGSQGVVNAVHSDESACLDVSRQRGVRQVRARDHVDLRSNVDVSSETGSPETVGWPPRNPYGLRLRLSTVHLSGSIRKF